MNLPPLHKRTAQRAQHFRGFGIFRLFGIMIILAGCAGPDDVAPVQDDLKARFGSSFEARNQDMTPLIPLAVTLEDGLTPDEAVLVALWNNRKFHVKLTELGLGRANVIQARQLQNPSVSMLFPTGPDPWELFIQLPMETFILMPKRHRIAKLELEQISQRMIETGLEVIRDTRIAHAELEWANQKVHLTSQSVDLHAQIHQLQQLRLEAGDIGELEQARAQVAALKMEETYNRLVREAAVAREKFRARLGLMFHDAPIRLTTAPPPPVDLAPLEDLLQIALTNRPVFKAVTTEVDIAGEKIGLSKMEILSLAGSIKIEREKDDGEYFNTYEAGFNVRVPILHQNQAGRKRAQVEFERAMKRYAMVREQISFDVRKAYATALQLQSKLEAWSGQIIPQLEENVALAEFAHQAGEATSLLPLTEQKHLNEGLAEKAAAVSEWHKAHAELDRSVGARLGTSNPPTLSHLIQP